jgi:hypothetical protein
MSEKTDTRTATQRIEDLEKVVTILYQGVNEAVNTAKGLPVLKNDIALLKEALKLLNKKTEAVILSAKAETGITLDAVTDLVTKMNVEELTAQVADYVKNGYLEPSDEASDNSYLVCEEYNVDGTLANPRIQFRVDSQNEETKTALKGKKAGDTVSFGENKLSAKVIEIYTLVQPKAPEATPVAETTQVATTETAPAATETTATQSETSDDSTTATESAPASTDATDTSETAAASSN